jgi:branched-chain amino acid transport system ATP-binding protein
MSATPALSTERLTRRFGALVVADAIDLRLEPGARHALIGPNGAGKTTLVNMLTGRLRPDAGSVRLGAETIDALSTAQRVKRGLVRTFQITTLCMQLTVEESVVLALAEREGCGWRMLRPLGTHRDLIDEARALLATLGLAARAAERVDALAYGEQRIVEVALALALRPKVLLLDEPAAGVPAAETAAILAVLARLPADIAILIIEHDMDIVFRFARSITVLDHGRIVAEGPPDAIARDAHVQDIYFGQRGRRAA